MQFVEVFLILSQGQVPHIVLLYTKKWIELEELCSFDHFNVDVKMLWNIRKSMCCCPQVVLACFMTRHPKFVVDGIFFTPKQPPQTGHTCRIQRIRHLTDYHNSAVQYYLH